MALGEALFFEDDYGAAATLSRAASIARSRRAPKRVNRCSSGGAAPSSVTPTRSIARPHQRLPAIARAHGARAGEKPRLRGGCVLFLVVATRGCGEPPRPGTPRSPAGSARGSRARGRHSLRADLDKLVLQGIIPDRVATMAVERREQAESDLRGEWAVVKERWK